MRNYRQHVRDNSTIKPSGCWDWKRSRFISNGYGQMRYHGKNMGAHRVSYMVFIGPIPLGLQIDHLCRNIICVNPDHLEAVTGAENLRRSGAWDVNRSKTECLRGHPFDLLNTLYYNARDGGGRYCRKCAADGARYRRWQRKGKITHADYILLRQPSKPKQEA